MSKKWALRSSLVKAQHLSRTDTDGPYRASVLQASEPRAPSSDAQQRVTSCSTPNGPDVNVELLTAPGALLGGPLVAAVEPRARPWPTSWLKAPPLQRPDAPHPWRRPRRRPRHEIRGWLWPWRRLARTRPWVAAVGLCRPAWTGWRLSGPPLIYAPFPKSFWARV